MGSKVITNNCKYYITMDVTTAKFRIQSGITLLVYSMIMTALDFAIKDLYVNATIIGSFVLLGGSLIGAGLVKKSNRQPEQEGLIK